MTSSVGTELGWAWWGWLNYGGVKALFKPPNMVDVGGQGDVGQIPRLDMALVGITVLAEQPIIRRSGGGALGPGSGIKWA